MSFGNSESLSLGRFHSVRDHFQPMNLRQNAGNVFLVMTSELFVGSETVAEMTAVDISG